MEKLRISDIDARSKLVLVDFDKIHVLQGLAQQPSHHVLDVDVVERTHCSIHIGSMKRWQSGGQCIQQDATELHPTAKKQIRVLHAVPFLRQLVGTSISRDFRSG